MSQFAAQSIGGFLDLLAAKCPAPGGGAAACMAGATAAALAHMVVAYSLGKKNLAEHQPLLESSSAALQRARAMLLQLADEDAAAYALVNELQKLPEGDARRTAEWGGAVAAAVAAPRVAMATCMEVLRMTESLAGKSNAYRGPTGDRGGAGRGRSARRGGTCGSICRLWRMRASVGDWRRKVSE